MSAVPEKASSTSASPLNYYLVFATKNGFLKEQKSKILLFSILI